MPWWDSENVSSIYAKFTLRTQDSFLRSILTVPQSSSRLKSKFTEVVQQQLETRYWTEGRQAGKTAPLFKQISFWPVTITQRHPFLSFQRGGNCGISHKSDMNSPSSHFTSACSWAPSPPYVINVSLEIWPSRLKGKGSFDSRQATIRLHWKTTLYNACIYFTIATNKVNAHCCIVCAALFFVSVSLNVSEHLRKGR